MEISTKDGTETTEEVAAELAREAEAGYDLSVTHRVGRRSLAGSTGKSPRLNFRVTTDLYAKAADRADREHKTISELAREALARYVA